jgi:TRAP-type mannitol/chloroaromatic compound transport system substrate-binding protein
MEVTRHAPMGTLGRGVELRRVGVNATISARCGRTAPRSTGIIRLTCQAIVVAVAVAMPGPAVAEEQPVVWRMNSLLHPKLFGEAGEHFARSVERVSGGTLVIEVHDRLVLDQDTFAALESGLVDAVWGSPGHHHREDPALTIFGGFPFGPDPAGFTAWMQAGGGAEALDAIYARHGLKSLYCGALPAEGGGWFVTPLSGPQDLDGLPFRSFGYGARVLQRLGAVTYELPAGEIRAAFAAGLIEAAEFSLPAIDGELGVAEVAGHLYFPGWQQPATPLEILMPVHRWHALSDLHRAAIEAGCAEAAAWSSSVAVVMQMEAIAEFRAAGIKLHFWPASALAALRQAWIEVIAEDTARDPLLAEAWEQYLRFSAAYSDWQARAYAD